MESSNEEKEVKDVEVIDLGPEDVKDEKPCSYHDMMKEKEDAMKGLLGPLWPFGDLFIKMTDEGLQLAAVQRQERMVQCRLLEQYIRLSIDMETRLEAVEEERDDLRRKLGSA